MKWVDAAATSRGVEAGATASQQQETLSSPFGEQRWQLRSAIKPHVIEL
jgi:hypothetical protein